MFFSLGVTAEYTETHVRMFLLRVPSTGCLGIDIHANRRCCDVAFQLDIEISVNELSVCCSGPVDLSVEGEISQNTTRSQNAKYSVKPACWCHYGKTALNFSD